MHGDFEKRDTLNKPWYAVTLLSLQWLQVQTYWHWHPFLEIYRGLSRNGTFAKNNMNLFKNAPFLYQFRRFQNILFLYFIVMHAQAQETKRVRVSLIRSYRTGECTFYICNNKLGKMMW